MVDRSSGSNLNEMNSKINEVATFTLSRGVALTFFCHIT